MKYAMDAVIMFLVVMGLALYAWYTNDDDVDGDGE